MTFRHLRNVRGFFSDYYLGSVFGRGQGRGRRKSLSDRDTDAAYRRFQRIYEQAEGRVVEAPACRERFIRPLLRDVMGYHLGAGEDRLHLLFASAENEAAGKSPIAVAYCGAWDEDLGVSRGKSAPVRQTETALAANKLAHGFLVTGERLRLIRTPGDGPRGAYLEVDLAGLAAEDDPESFAAFYRLFHFSQFLPDSDGQIPIQRVELESREHAEKVSEDLKRAVFIAAESLVSGILKDRVEREMIKDPTALADSDLRSYRDSALTGLYRILFILYAEARDPRLHEHRLYLDSYSIHGLVEELLQEPSRDWPENRSGLWNRLKALFRIYDQGLPQITPWENIPPRGGDFFKADTAEGRILDAANLPDRTVARMLLDLTTTAPRQGVGRERVSFQELDIESLGAVYEGLLEYEPRVARETTIELHVLGRTFALSPAEVIRLCKEKSLSVKGDFMIVEGTAAESLHPEAPTGEEEGEEILGEEETEEEESGEELEEGVKKGAAVRLLRRLDPGAFYFVPGPARKGSGSFYTPLPLVRDLIRHALGPLAIGKKVSEIENLRIIDPACGSAHFLIEAMRFLGRELHRAYVLEYSSKVPPAFARGQWDSDWKATDEEARAANSEARAWCKRRVAERCLFGVDLNPTAVTLARVALWIESLAGDRPLTYFEHHVRCGNSLLGTWLKSVNQPPLPTMGKRESPTQRGLFPDLVRKAVEKAAQDRLLIDRAADEGAVEPESIQELDFKEHQQKKAEETLAGARILFNLRSASGFLPDIWAEWATLCSYISDLERLEAYVRSRPWWEVFRQVAEREKFFHWELEFPEVFLEAERFGFDVVLGNPPWDKVLPSKIEFYARYDILIRAYRGNELDRRIREIEMDNPGIEETFAIYRKRTNSIAHFLRHGGDFPLSKARTGAAHEDISKFFVDRAIRLIKNGGASGLVLPSVLYNGDGCVEIRKFLLTEAVVKRFYAFENRKKIFPIDSRYKFVNLVFQKIRPENDGFHAAFMRHDLTELENDETKPWTVEITYEEIKRLSPETLAFLEYRSPIDQDIVHKMYAGRPTFGGNELGSWGVTLFTDLAHMQIYNSSRDKDLWTDDDSGRLYSPSVILGQGLSDARETINYMDEHGFWPVFEGKHIEQFLVGIKPIRWWLSVKKAKEKYGITPRPEAALFFRDTASNTNERTCIAAVLPHRSSATNTLYGVLLKNVNSNAAAAVLNSLCFDFALRLRTAGTHVSFTYIRPMPVPKVQSVNLLPEIPTQFAWNRNINHISDDQELWLTLWSSNRAVAQAYGLTPDDFEHILNSFPVFARKRPEFYAYLRGKLAEWKKEVEGDICQTKRYRSATLVSSAAMAAETSSSYPPENGNVKPTREKIDDNHSEK